MKQLLIKGGEIIVEQVPAPVVEAGHVLVDVRYSLISAGTEMSALESSGRSLVGKALEQPERVKKLWDHLRTQGLHKTIAKLQSKVSQPVPVGYSCSGRVIEVGAGINDLRPGDRVACAGSGLANHAEVVQVPRNLVVNVPDGCDLRDAASVTLGAIAMQGVRRADPRLGEVVVVTGLGLLGQITVQLLKAAGCRVIGLDLDDRRVVLARELGAADAFNPARVSVENEVRHRTHGHGADAVIITAASESDAVVQQAMELARKKGRVVVVGAVGLGLQRSPFYEKEIDFLISCSYGPGRYDERYEEQGLDYPYAYVRWTEGRNMREYLRLIARGEVRVKGILEEEFPLSQAPRAYAALGRAANRPLGVLLSYPAEGDVRAGELGTKVVLRSRATAGKVRVAVVGAGSFAKEVHLPNLQKLSDFYHVQAVVSRTGSNAQATAQHFNANYATTDYREALDDPDVDAVLICTPHHLHARQAMEAAQAGKAVFLEKPMALDANSLDRLVGVLRETRVPFMVGFNRRFSPAARRAKELIAGRQNPLMISYRVNAGYLPPQHWTQTEVGGGRLVGEACHIFDLFRYLIDESITELSALAITPRKEHVLASDNVVVTLKYVDGSVATLLYTALGSAEVGKEYMELYVDGKVLVLDDYRSLQVHGAKARGWSARRQDKGHEAELRAFAEYLSGKREMPLSLPSIYETTMASFLAGAGYCGEWPG
jgi:predicted dehydrogenase/threonine dehydrogenase-like Zn-dependent dehydrogenase